MNVDTLELREFVKKAFDSIIKAINNLLDKLKSWFETVGDLLQPSNSLKKTKYDHVRKIAPRKLILLDKRTNIHYCRNNC